MKSLAAGTNPSSPQIPQRWGTLNEKSCPKVPSLGGWGAEVLNSEAEKLHRTHVLLVSSERLALEQTH